MRISRVHLKNFRRFTDLTIQDIPGSARLVLLIGSNGSGKTCVFDGFEVMNSITRNEPMIVHPFYRKEASQGPPEATITSADGVEYRTLPGSSTLPKNSFYGRTSFRQVPRLTRTALGQARTPVDLRNDSDRPRMFIDRDDRFENDIERIAADILRDFFRTQRPREELRQRYIDPLNQAFINIFGTANGTRLELVELIPPLDGQTARIGFRKGGSEFHYDQLSAGEKEVVNILMNLLARREYFPDAVYFFDEIDLHLNTRLQFNLLKEITENWVPGGCQFWTASHSLGFIDYANQSDQACIIDFDDLDFDKPQVLTPEPKDRSEVFQVAVPKEFVEQYVRNIRFVFCENQDEALLTGLSIPDTLFSPMVDKQSVFHRAKGTGLGLLDRDYLTDAEADDILALHRSIRLLPYYSIENLLFHPDNLAEHHASIGKDFDRAAYTDAITKVKNAEKDYLIGGIAQARSGYPFFKENEHHERLRKFRSNTNGIIDLLRSDEFEVFYKVFPAKELGGTIPARQNLNRSQLARTGWFRGAVIAALEGRS